MILFANNASTSLANACSDSDSYIDIAPGMAELFPSPGTEDDYFLVTLTNPNDGSLEIMKVTSVYGDRFNVSRAQEGTTAMGFPQNTIVENRLTAGSLTQLLNDIAATTSEAGRLRLATLAEALAGIVQDAAVSPYTMNAMVEAKIQPIIDTLTTKINNMTINYVGVPGELKYFFEANAPAGWAECNDLAITEADTTAPGLYARLQLPQNTFKLTSETNWQALHDAVYATDAAGGSYRWANVGGVAKFVLDTTAKTIRLPDLRGMVMESSGFDGLTPGGVHGDGLRTFSSTNTGASGYFSIAGGFFTGWSGCFSGAGSGPLETGSWGPWGANVMYINLNVAQNLVYPKANKIQPRAFGVILCVCLGITND